MYAKWNPAGGGGGGGGSKGTPVVSAKDITISITVPPSGTLTPIYGAGVNERSVTFSIDIPELTGSETVNIALAANSYGLSLPFARVPGTEKNHDRFLIMLFAVSSDISGCLGT